MGVSASAEGTWVRVWAPNATAVEIVGDFNGWKASAGERLQKDQASGIWTVLLRRSLPKGAYQFLINGQLRRRDPYGRAVSPDGKNSLFYDPEAFDWQGVRPVDLTMEDSVIYELHVGAFNDPNPQDGRPATFDDVVKRLDYLVELGVTTVLLMPIHEFAGQHSWGYNPSDPFAVEQAYGGPDGLKTLVRECHRRGLAVHLDIVHNHYGPENLDLLKFDGTGGDALGGIYFYDAPELSLTPWGPRVRFEAPMVRRFVKDNALMWLGEYRVDGFRWDSTVNIRAYDMGNKPLPAGQQMLDEVNAAIRDAFPRRLSIAEDSLNIGTFDGSWDYDFHHSVMGELKAKDDADRRISSIGNTIASRPEMRRVIYVDNHDEAGKLNGQSRIANDAAPSDPSGDLARRISGLGALLTLTAPGTPLLFMGNEFQQTGSFHEDVQLDWGKRTRHAGLLALHRDLIRLRRNLDRHGPALQGLEVEIPVQDENRKLLVYWRWHSQAPNERMVMAVNLSAQPLLATVPFPSAGPWVTRLNTDGAKYGGGSKDETTPFNFKAPPFKGRTSLAPYSARIFTLADPAVAAKQEPMAAAVEENPAARTFSMYASINVVGTFNNGNLTNAPLKRNKGLVWEGRINVPTQDGVSFKLSANHDGVIYWGAGQDATITPPYRGALARLGPDIKVNGSMGGAYKVIFNEENQELTLEPMAGAPPPEPFRTWTDAKGRQVEARLLGLQSGVVLMESRAGQKLKVPLDSLSADDQAYARASQTGK
jgi:1,4-alpha-glucan branching enzyme